MVEIEFRPFCPVLTPAYHLRSDLGSEWVERKYRLTRSEDINRVWRSGRTFAHPFALMAVYPNQLDLVRIGISAGKSVGGAVERNRAKRRARAVMDRLFTGLKPGFDIMVSARQPLVISDFTEIVGAFSDLVKRAGIVIINRA